MLEYLIEHQYELPHKLFIYASRYPNVTFKQALELYEISVKEVLILYKAKHLYDLPLSYGKGLVAAKNLWLDKMNEAELIERENRGRKNETLD